MRISEAEQKAIIDTIEAGKRFGFGNLISHLATAWARTLVRDYGMSEEAARKGAWGIAGYPFKMQDDLVRNGEWDETGERYV